MSGPMFDRAGGATIVAGESRRPSLSIQHPDGTLADLSGRQMRWRVISADGTTEVFGADAVIAGTVATADLPGSDSIALTDIGLTNQWIELVAEGFVVWVKGTFQASLGGPAMSGSAAPGEDVVVADERGAVMITANGAPGLTAYQLAVAHGFEGSEADYLQSLRQPAEDAAADADAARGDAIAATAAANEAAANLTALAGESAPLLAQILMPPGATTIAADSANAILIGDLL